MIWKRKTASLLMCLVMLGSVLFVAASPAAANPYTADKAKTGYQWGSTAGEYVDKATGAFSSAINFATGNILGTFGKPKAAQPYTGPYPRSTRDTWSGLSYSDRWGAIGAGAGLTVDLIEAGSEGSNSYDYEGTVPDDRYVPGVGGY